MKASPTRARVIHQLGLRSLVSRWVLATVIVLVPYAAPQPAYAQMPQQRVLVLYSTREDGQFSVIGERELPRTLAAALPRNLDYYSEFIDLARSPGPDYERAFRDFLRQKYQGLRFDLVIAMHDSAVGFVEDYGNAVFPDT